MSTSDDITVRSTKNFAIRDAVAHTWSIDLERYGQIAIYLTNNLDQNITVQYYGGSASAPVLLTGKGGTIASGGGTDSEDFTGAMGWIRISITAAGVPTTGAVNVIVDGEKGTQTSAELHQESHDRGAEDEITGIFDEIDALDIRITSCCGSGVGSGLGDRVTTLEAEMDAAQADIIALEAIVGSCTSGVGSGLCVRVEQLESDVDGLNTSVTNLQNITTIHGTEIGDLQDIVGTCSSGVGSGLCQRVEALESDIDGINTTLSTHGTDIEKNKKAQYSFMVAGTLTSGIDATMWQSVLQDCTLTELRGLVKVTCSGLDGIGIGVDRSLDCGLTWNGLINPSQIVIPCGDNCITVSGLSVALAKDDTLRLNLNSVGSVVVAEDLHVFLRTTNDT